MGNGFDLNFGLQTRLSDFGTYLKGREADIFHAMEGLHGLAGPVDEPEDFRQWNLLEARMAQIHESFVLEEAQWSFDRQEDYPPPSDDFWEYAAEHFEEVVNPILHELPWLVRCWALSVDITDSSEEKVSEYECFGRRNGDAAFVTFNYTRVLEDICDLTSVYHVHGAADAGDVVIGHSAEFVRAAVRPGDIQEAGDLFDRFEEYNKFFKKRHAGIFDGVSEFLSSATCDRHIDEVIVCGHSVGEADREYFLMISQRFPDATWAFTPYGGQKSPDHLNIKKLTDDPRFSSKVHRLRSLDEVIGG